ncbi:MAG: hypothetical protein Ct9H300mP5_3360 [Candidatus Pelagibacterales bacterium]|nr:MAG: hypothetical protein Ct9H300mP5_3360 [Pelagibacterales bacterium]
MIKYGTNIFWRGHSRQRRPNTFRIPVFNTVKDAVKKTGATASILFVPPEFAADSAMEQLMLVSKHGSNHRRNPFS